MTDPSRLADLERELAEERAKNEAMRTPVCIGRETIAILAREGAVTLGGVTLIAADELFQRDPFKAAESLAATARRDAFEEAAKVADDFISDGSGGEGEAGDYIRSLTTVPGGEGKTDA